jgi:hypothetical protein
MGVFRQVKKAIHVAAQTLPLSLYYGGQIQTRHYNQCPLFYLDVRISFRRQITAGFITMDSGDDKQGGAVLFSGNKIYGHFLVCAAKKPLKLKRGFSRFG